MNNKIKTVILLFLLPLFAFAQSVVTGVVTDKDNLPVLGATVLVKGTQNATSTDFDGKYTLSNVPEDAVIVISYIGYATQEIPVNGQSTINVTLADDTSELDTIVLIGYGSTTKENVTAAQTTVDEEEFNKGAIVSPGQLLAGKAAGVQVTAATGSPGEGPRIRVRAGSTLSASQDPLYVVDGIPLDAANANLNSINPADIADITILKDASATAIYGNRGSNGVILITTKKGKMSSDLKISFSTQLAINENTDEIDVLTGDQFRGILNEFGTPEEIALLGNFNTDWQDEIYTTGIQGIHNLVVEKGFEKTAVRASLNYTNQNGTLEGTGYERATLNANIIQKLLNNDLKLTLNVQGAAEQRRFTDGGAIGTALSFDPTQPVFDPNGPNGYFEYLQNNGNVDELAPRNPVGLINSLTSENDNNQIRATLIADYKVPGIDGLKFVGTAGIDYNEFDEFSRRDPNSGVGLTTGALRSNGDGYRVNQLLRGRFDYNKELESISTVMDLTVGSAFQNFQRESVFRGQDDNGIAIADQIGFNNNRLISFFGRASFDINDLFVLSGSINREGTSRFSPDQRWGTFWGANGAIKLTNLDFVQNSGFLSQLKLRGGYGVTGQQEIGQDFLFVQGRVVPSNAQAQVQLGSQFYNTLRPSLALDLKWEETYQWNAGVDFGFFEDRLTISVDGYTRDTEDLFQDGPLPVGSLGNRSLQNVGATRSRGIEVGAGLDLFRGDDFNWNIGGNVTFQEIEITDLTLGDDDQPTPINTVSGGGFNNFIGEWAVGADPTVFVVYRQVYDASGNPLDGVFVDRNGDNVINSDDRYRYKKGNPDAYFGFTSNLTYKNFDMSFTFRGQVGGYNYNNVRAGRENIDSITETTTPFLNNPTSGILQDRFQSAPLPLLFSSHYIESSDFVRLDNLSLGYRFNTDKVGIRASVTGTNLFVITDYSGLDPEIAGGIDGAIYPRSRGIILGLNFDF
ncbi:SusC/RagA family TonB-linked outer membrane protein [Nonlabens spongiae]|uniref:SusC/RagA family TonB-linked outer membrane protein n=1 Tax=Nonlabens spongiae TaxID=331648 RepID=A0A1W6MME0_9FLAO|nr:SusC/RagA family TonB-linked outer membrane protein [Nonlabens spongiae]ARN78765.1 SusC/RagA family TonB-linked outer membrane protein [Nonlabens spongiae]